MAEKSFLLGKRSIAIFEIKFIVRKGKRRRKKKEEEKEEKERRERKKRKKEEKKDLTCAPKLHYNFILISRENSLEGQHFWKG